MPMEVSVLTMAEFAVDEAFGTATVPDANVVAARRDDNGATLMLALVTIPLPSTASATGCAKLSRPRQLSPPVALRLVAKR